MIEFVVSDGVLLEYNGSEAVVQVPEGITQLADWAFANRQFIQEVILPEGLTHIGYAAFAGCAALRRITLPDSLETLGGASFNRCNALEEIVYPHVIDGVLYNRTHTEAVLCVKSQTGVVRVPEGVVHLHRNAFADCSGITRIHLPKSLRRIDKGAFRNCSGLQEMVIPEGVFLGWNDIFQGCTGLRKLRVMQGVKGFGMAFLLGLKLRCVENETGEFLLTGENGAADYVSTLDEGFLPLEDMEEIPACFKPMAVACYLSSRERYSKEEQAMYDGYIAKQAGRMLAAFVAGGCTGSIQRLLETGKVTPAAVKKVLETGTADPVVTAMLLQWQNAHVDMAKEREREEKKELRALARVETPLQRLKKRFVTKPLPDGTLMLAAYMGEEAEVTVPAEIGGVPITVIGKKAFSPRKNTRNKLWKQEGITKVTLPESIRIIEEKAFLQCTALRKVVLPHGLQAVGDQAFSGCFALEEMVLPDTVQDLGAGAFDSCSGLKKLKLPKQTRRIPSKLCSYCTSLQELELPDTVEDIGSNAFACCNSLTQLPLPAAMTAIGAYAFARMESLTEITLPGRIRFVGDRAFFNCGFLEKVTFCEGVETLSGQVFDGCVSLERVVLPGSVTKIGDRAFQVGFRMEGEVTLYVPIGSYAESYAKKNKYACEAI